MSSRHGGALLADSHLAEHFEHLLVETLGVAPRRSSLGDDLAEATALARKNVVRPVDERRQAQDAEHDRERRREREHCEHRDSAALVAGDRRPVTKHEPPAFAALVFGNRAEELLRFGVAERKQCQPLRAVERGDDTRRPAAELSGSRVEQDRADQLGTLTESTYFARR